MQLDSQEALIRQERCVIQGNFSYNDSHKFQQTWRSLVDPEGRFFTHFRYLCTGGCTLVKISFRNKKKKILGVWKEPQNFTEKWPSAMALLHKNLYFAPRNSFRSYDPQSVRLPLTGTGKWSSSMLLLFAARIEDWEGIRIKLASG